MKTVKVLFTAIFVFAASIIFAAPSPPPTTGSPSCWPPPCIPIDNGVILLVVAGALFGAKKLYDLRTKSEAIS